MNGRSIWLHPIAAILGIFALIANSSSSFGQEPDTIDKQKAESLTRDAGALMDVRNYADACPKLEKAIQLKPDAIGGYILLGECYERSNKFQSACDAFGRAKSLAEQKNDSRAYDAIRSCQSIERMIPRVLLNVPKTLKNLDHWTITLDGLPYYVNLDKFAQTHQAELKMDSGPHYVTILFDGRLAWGRHFAIENNEFRSIAVSNRPIFEQMPGRYEAVAWFLAIPSGIALVGGCAATGMAISSSNEFSSNIALGAGLGLIGVGAVGIVGYVMLKSANQDFERAAYRSATARSPSPQLQFGIAPNGVSLKGTF